MESRSPSFSLQQAAKDRANRRLTEEEKRKNHVESEHNRRNNIRNGFDRLTEIVPDTEGQARSEGRVLKKTFEYIRELMLERQRMIAFLESKGAAVDPELKASLETLPEGFLEGKLDSDQESGDEREEDVAEEPDPEASPPLSPQRARESQAERSRSNSEDAREARVPG